VGSSVKSYNPYYDIDLRMDSSRSSSSTSSAGTAKTTIKGKKSTHQQFSTAFQYWFDEDGVLAQDQFEADIVKFLANTEATHIE
jgi:signal peptidase complex subunit 2